MKGVSKKCICDICKRNCYPYSPNIKFLGITLKKGKRLYPDWCTGFKRIKGE